MRGGGAHSTELRVRVEMRSIMVQVPFLDMTPLRGCTLPSLVGWCSRCKNQPLMRRGAACQHRKSGSLWLPACAPETDCQAAFRTGEKTVYSARLSYRLTRKEAKDSESLAAPRSFVTAHLLPLGGFASQLSLFPCRETASVGMDNSSDSLPLPARAI